MEKGVQSDQLEECSGIQSASIVGDNVATDRGGSLNLRVVQELGGRSIMERRDYFGGLQKIFTELNYLQHFA